MISRLFGSSHSSMKNVRNSVHVPAANTAAVITLTDPGNGLRYFLHNIQWSYSAAPTGGRILVQSNSVTLFDVDVIVGGPGGYNLNIPATPSEDLVITLAAGGGSVAGKINVQYSLESD